MPSPNDRGSYAAMSDAELRALEKDGSLSADEWRAVEEELSRRAAARPASASAPPPREPRGAAAPTAPPATTAGAGAEDYRIAEALGQLRALLVPGETLQAYAVQRRLFALAQRRLVVAATSGRFIAFQRGLFGGYTLGDVRWQDLQDASLRAGIFGADLTISQRATGGTQVQLVVPHPASGVQLA